MIEYNPRIPLSDYAKIFQIIKSREDKTALMGLLYVGNQSYAIEWVSPLPDGTYEVQLHWNTTGPIPFDANAKVECLFDPDQVLNRYNEGEETMQLVTLEDSFAFYPVHPEVNVEVIRLFRSFRHGDLTQAKITFEGQRINGNTYRLADGSLIEFWRGTLHLPARLRIIEK